MSSAMSGWLTRPTVQTGMSTASRTARARCRQMPVPAGAAGQWSTRDIRRMFVPEMTFR